MATGSGQIGMNDMRNEITRATSSALSMSEIRTRYGGSSDISFSQLRKSEGFTVTNGSFYAGGKPPVDIVGFDRLLATVGTVSPAENSGRVEFTTNCVLESFFSANNDTAGTMLFSGSPPGGFQGTDVTRVVTANTSRTITSSSGSGVNFTYGFVDGQTIHCLIKF